MQITNFKDVMGGSPMMSVKEVLGNIMEGSVVSIIYDRFSSAWVIGLAIVSWFIQKGDFGIISNYNLPVSKLADASRFVGFDLRKALREDNLAIIDIFGSRYGNREELKNVFYLDTVDPETINPKISMIYSNLKPLMKGKPIIRLVYTLDGAALILGEDETLKILNQTLAHRSRELPSSIMILPVNKDVVSERFVSWIASISDYVLVGTSEVTNRGLVERFHLVKSPMEGFEPTTYDFKVSKERKVERLKFKKLSP